MKSEKTWIVVADAGQARVYETGAVGQKLVERTDLALAEDIPPGRHLERDRAARSFQSAGAGRHAMTPAETPRRALKREFAETVAAMLDRAVAEKLCDRLVIAAPPAMLGDLRAALKAETKRHVAGELAKDLVKTPAADLREHFGAVVVI